MSDDVDDFLMGGGVPAAKFAQLGDKCIGRVTSDRTMTQQTTLKGELRFYKDGQPMMQAVVTLEVTNQRDPDNTNDDGARRLWVKGEMQKAIREAVKASGAKTWETGGMLGVEYIGDGISQGPGYDPPKLYRAQYRPPAVAADDLLASGGQTSAPPASTTPAAPQSSPTAPSNGGNVVADNLLPG